MPRFAAAACLVLALVAATAMTRTADALQAADTAALTTEAHALVAEMQQAATTQDDHPLALLDSPDTYQALTIEREHGSYRLTAYGPGEGLLTFSDTEGTPHLRVRFDRDGILATETLV